MKRKPRRKPTLTDLFERIYWIDQMLCRVDHGVTSVIHGKLPELERRIFRLEKNYPGFDAEAARDDLDGRRLRRRATKKGHT